MMNPMKYIRDLEAVGFERDQAEAQVKVVLDAIEGDLVTKNDFAIFRESFENRYGQFEKRIENSIEHLEQRTATRFEKFEQNFESKFIQHKQEVQIQFRESELRMTARIGVMLAASMSLTVAILSWLQKS